MASKLIFDYANKLVISKTRSAIPSGTLAAERKERKAAGAVRLAKEFSGLAIKQAGGENSGLDRLAVACEIQELVVKAAENELAIERLAMAKLEEERSGS